MSDIGFLVIYNLIAFFLGYLWGSLNTSILVSKFIFKDDIRKHGSGNAGSTNITRRFGVKVGGAIFAWDIFRVYLFSLFIYIINTHSDLRFNPVVNIYPQIAAFGIVLGHIFTVFFKFKGGKGAATVVGMFLTVNVLLFLIGAALWIALMFYKKIVSVATIFANLLVIPLFFLPWMTYSGIESLSYLIPHNAFLYLDTGYPIAALVSGLAFLLAAAIIIGMHHSNIKRLLNKTEKPISLRKKTA
ncbi:hypothetical protein CJJ23_02190 [Mycoplasmopsis agassizii]|uniref:Glycerol-3-phosphate acyltransferase n=1 Tax=Mycoplasmopsis agassizii TaxID=33922 RepID=A0A269TK46_9BACT|nr:glycerol-3-phosphate acyltransferase [Mycoplasmopsis agassizii]PAK21436.1 hypothetical protein CJJ23_02190 [Mycoplasmopsis agassizii]